MSAILSTILSLLAVLTIPSEPWPAAPDVTASAMSATTPPAIQWRTSPDSLFLTATAWLESNPPAGYCFLTMTYRQGMWYQVWRECEGTALWFCPDPDYEP